MRVTLMEMIKYSKLLIFPIPISIDIMIRARYPIICYHGS